MTIIFGNSKNSKNKIQPTKESEYQQFPSSESPSPQSLYSPNFFLT